MGFNDPKLKVDIVGDAGHLQSTLAGLHGDFNKLGGGFTAAFGRAMPIVGAAAVGVTAVGTAVAGLGAALFNVTKNAAEFGSEIFDASQKTGLGAEALSSLKAAAETSGASFEQVTKAISKFAIGFKGSSQDLQSELGKVMERIANAKPGFEQLKLSADAFGKKLGPEMIPLIMEFRGNLGGLIERMKDLGVTIDDDAARAADQFGDQLDILKMQLAGVGRTIGTELMPEFTAMATGISNWIVDHKSDINNLAVATGDVTRGIILYWNDATAAIRDFLSESRAFGSSPFKFSDYLDPEFLIGGTLLKSARFRGEAEREKREQMDANVVRMMGDPGTYLSTRSGSFPSSSTGDDSKYKSKPKRPAKESDEEFRKFFTDMGFSVVRTFGSAINKGSPHPFGGAADISIKGKSADQIFTLMVKALEKGYRVFDERKPAPGVKQTGPHVHVENARNSLTKASRFLDLGFTPEQVAYLENLDKERLGKATGMGGFEQFQTKQTDEAAKKQKEITDAFEREADRRVEIGQSMTESLIELAEYEYQKSLEYNDPSFAIAAAKQIYDLKLDLIDDEILALEEKAERAVAGSTEESEIVHKLNLKKIERNRIEKKANDDFEQRGKAILDYQIKRGYELLQIEQERLRVLEERNLEESRRGGFLSTPPTAVGHGGLTSGEDPLGGSDSFGDGGFMGRLDEATGKIRSIGDVWKQVGDMATDVFMQMGQGLGNMLETWVLMGDQADVSMKKMVAATLAGVASQAATLAVFHTAMGIAALTPWGAAIYGPAVLHFKAAAIWGAIAAGTALAGRAVAGDSFKQGGGASAGAGGYSGGQGSSSAPPSPITRQSDYAFTSGRRSHEMAVADAINKLNAKIDSMSPGDVLTAGAKQRSGFIGRQAAQDVRGDYASARTILKAGGVT